MSDSGLLAQKAVRSLPPIELAFLQHLVAGWSQSSIAAHLRLPEQDAREVRRSLFERLGATYTADAVRIGIRAGL